MNSSSNILSKYRNRQRFPKKRNGGWTLIELTFVVVLIGILGTAAVIAGMKMLDRAHDSKAQQIQDDFNSWYGQWTHAGGQHNAAPATKGGMALTLMTLMTSAPGGAGVKSAPDSYGNWTDESKLRIKGSSYASSCRYSTEKTMSYDAANDWVVFDNSYAVTFTATSTNTGSFTVNYIQ